MEETTHRVPKSPSQAVLSRMPVTPHATRRTPHGASRLVLAVVTRSVKTRRTPSRHCRCARRYDLKATVVHDNERIRPPPRGEAAVPINSIVAKKEIIRALLEVKK